MKFVFRRVGNIAGKGNAGYQHFVFFPQRFQKAFYTGSLKVVIVWERVNIVSFRGDIVLVVCSFFTFDSF